MAAPRRETHYRLSKAVAHGGISNTNLSSSQEEWMATLTQAQQTRTDGGTGIVEMAWDPITRIVGSLGIYTKIDFGQRKVVECHSTSSVFRGYSIFMKGKDPRDAHFITSRICGICGDNHATCSCYTQNMAYGVKPPHLAEWIINLGEAAEYMFDHNIFQENLVGVDFCEKMVRETNPGVWEQAQKREAPNAAAHGYRTIGDIMRSLNPFEGELYREALQMSRLTREMFCLMEGRHVHPSTLYPGGVGTVATVQLFTDYLTRLMKYIEFMKKMVPLHDDLFNFFYEALPGYEKVGQRRILLGCWGSLQNPDYCNFRYRDMTEWGRKMFVTPGIIIDGRLITTDLVKINLGIRILLGSSYYEDWVGKEIFVREDPLGNPVDKRHPWNQHTIPIPQKRNLDGGKYSWVMSPRWFDGKEHIALDTGGGPIARLWATALAGLADFGYIKATGSSVIITLPRTAARPEARLEWKIPQWSNTIERDRARTYFQAYAAACALYFVEKGLDEVRSGRHKTFEEFEVPDEAIGCGFTEAVRGVLSHHMVIRDGKIANYHPYPPTPWNASPRDSYGTPGPYEDAVQGQPIFEENSRDRFKGIDIMRTVRSFDPCLPCGVHMYLGGGKVIEKRHSPALLHPE
jgi:hydrogenase large subunit